MHLYVFSRRKRDWIVEKILKEMLNAFLNTLEMEEMENSRRWFLMIKFPQTNFFQKKANSF